MAAASAGFLNKKTWHPGRMSNQEAVSTLPASCQRSCSRSSSGLGWHGSSQFATRGCASLYLSKCKLSQSGPSRSGLLCARLLQLWKAEEKAAKEQREVEALRKQYAAEREREELREVAIAGGHLRCAPIVQETCTITALSVINDGIGAWLHRCAAGDNCLLRQQWILRPRKSCV